MATEGTMPNDIKTNVKNERCSAEQLRDEDSRSSYDSWLCCKSEKHSPSLPESGSNKEDDDAPLKKISSLSSLFGGRYAETPKIKSNGVLNQPVRRKLVFSSQDENSLEECPPSKARICIDGNRTLFPGPVPPVKQEAGGIPKRILLGIKKGNTDEQHENKAPVISQGPDFSSKSKPLVPPKDPVKQEESKEIGVSRKRAQLVVWTKNIPVRVTEKPEKDYNVIKESAVTSTFISNNDPELPEGNLFFVQCPVRSAADSSKKLKAQKRIKNSPKKSKRKIAHEKRSATQGSSSGRAYRTYLHSCLEKQRQQLLGADFKVEKLFQPDQGVALPGEVLPPSELPACISSVPTFTPLLPQPPSNNQSNTLDLIIATTAPSTPAAHCEISDNFMLTPSTPTSALPAENCENPNECVLAPPNNNAGEVGGDENIFDLPDRFTVTTDSANEFDLLIQNVVHEEMVGDDEDDLMLSDYEHFRKRMRMSNSGSSSEERLNMDEAGKPRCTYTELIEKALTESGGLTVSEIYTWISDRYPFFKPDDDRWKNSVRHNLSINPYFKKGDKARSGAGHLWTISEESKGLRPSMVSWDERRKSPSDFSDLIMPMESETDRAVANILGQYLSECRANKEASEKGKLENNNTSSMESENQNESSAVQSTGNLEVSQPMVHQQLTEIVEHGATCNTGVMHEPDNFNLNELNSGQFTVDLGGITIPEGGAINFEELVNAGRLIYIQTDPDANKENDNTQAIVLNECFLSELSALTNSVNTQDDTRFNSFYSEQLTLDLGFGKGDTFQSTSFPNDGSVGSCQDVMTCGQLVPQSEATSDQQHQQNLTELDQVIPMSYEELSSGNTVPAVSDNLHTMTSAALYESKELGISYTYQTEPSNNDIL